MSDEYDPEAEAAAFIADKQRAASLGVVTGYTGKALVHRSAEAVNFLRMYRENAKARPALRGLHDTVVPFLLWHNEGRFENVRDLHLQVAARYLSWQIQWAMYGLPVFGLTHSLAAGLTLTEPAVGEDDELRLPFPAFLIRMPSPDGPLTFNAIDGSIDTATHLLISTNRWMLTKQHSGLTMVRDEDIANIPWEPFFSLIAVGESHTELNQNLPMPSRGGIQGWIDGMYEAGGLTALDQQALRSIKAFIANFCSYINEHPDRAQWDGTRSAQRTATRPRVFSVGAEVKLPAEMRVAARAYAARDRDAGDWTRLTRFVVRGHMHHYWYGPKGGERLLRSRWVQPYWKGPETGIPAPRTYAVDERKKQS
jgi:hypothetical protein